MNLATEWFN